VTRPEPILLERLRRVHEALDAAGYDHAVGGGIALAVHSREPRFTDDIDLNVLADPDRPEAILDVLPTDLDIHPTAARELRETGQVRVMWRDPDTPLDLFLPQHPAYHQLVNDRAQPVNFLGVDVLVITATDLMVFKMLFDRSKDWVDIEQLLRAEAGDPDEAASWVASFLGADASQLERLARLRATL